MGEKPKLRQVSEKQTGAKTKRRKKSNVSDTLIMFGFCLIVGLVVVVFSQRQQLKNNEVLEKLEHTNELQKQSKEQENFSITKKTASETLPKETKEQKILTSGPDPEMMSYLEGLKTEKNCPVCGGSGDFDFWNSDFGSMQSLPCLFCSPTGKLNTKRIFTSSIDICKENDEEERGAFIQKYLDHAIFLHGKILNVGYDKVRSFNGEYEEGWVILEGANNFGLKCYLVGQMNRVKTIKIGSHCIVFAIGFPEDGTSPSFKIARLIWGK